MLLFNVLYSCDERFYIRVYYTLNGISSSYRKMLLVKWAAVGTETVVLNNK